MLQTCAVPRMNRNAVYVAIFASGALLLICGNLLLLSGFCKKPPCGANFGYHLTATSNTRNLLHATPIESTPIDYDLVEDPSQSFVVDRGFRIHSPSLDTTLAPESLTK